MSFKEKHELDQLTKEIETLESNKSKFVNKLNSGDLPYNELTSTAQEIEIFTKSLEDKEIRWLELSEE